MAQTRALRLRNTPNLTTPPEVQSASQPAAPPAGQVLPSPAPRTTRRDHAIEERASDRYRGKKKK